MGVDADNVPPSPFLLPTKSLHSLSLLKVRQFFFFFYSKGYTFPPLKSSLGTFLRYSLL